MQLNTDEYAGRVIMTWPAPAPTLPHLTSWGISITDADSGKPILDALKVAIVLGSDDGFEQQPIAVELTRLLDANGEPTGNSIAPAVGPPDTDGRLPTAVFRYLVAEMAIAPGQP